jgi:Xaa-Pro aminopeptidase
MLDPVLAKARQDRLLRATADQNLDAIVLTQPHHVYYLTAHLPEWRHTPALVLRDGRATLICANDPAENIAADDVRSYPANLGATLRQDQAYVVAPMIAELVAGAGKVGYDPSPVAATLLQDREAGAWVPIDGVLWQQRRAKDADELALMRRAIAATRAMYQRARALIAPGVPEILIYNELAAAAVHEFGEPMSAMLGNDFACGVGGGPPRNNRLAEAGELWVLDLGPAFRGYFADNARVVSVGRKPTDAQQTAWRNITDVFPIVEAMAKPGVRCRDIYDRIDAHFQERFSRKQHHHLGHGIGLEAHEFPHLNPNWDDTLIEGEIFTCEPGIYTETIRSAIRIENLYRVTAAGVENLTPFPLELT